MSIDQHTDLLKAFNEGNKEAFIEVYDKHFAGLLHFARNITNDIPAAEDIVADTFITLFKRKELFESVVNIRAFLYVMTRNACFNFLRQRETARKNNPQYAYLLNEALLLDLDYQDHNDLLIQYLHAAIESLPDVNKKIITLYYFEQVTSDEIAEAFNIDRKTVHSHLRYARQRIRKLMLHKINTIK